MVQIFEIRYSVEAAKDLKALRPFDRQEIIQGVEDHLQNHPSRVSKSRIKKMRQPALSQYRLRISSFRVYYDLDKQEKIVYILRILQKSTSGTPRVNES